MVNDQIHELDLNETILADQNGVIPERKHPFTLQNLEQGSVQKISIRAVNDNTTSHYVDMTLILLLNMILKTWHLTLKWNVQAQLVAKSGVTSLVIVYKQY